MVAALVLALLGGCDRSEPVAKTDAKAAAKSEPAKRGPVAGPSAIAVPDGPVTAKTLVAFLPERMAGASADMREAVDEALAAAAYRTPTGFVNVNLSLVRDLGFERAQVKGAETDAKSESNGIAKQGVAVGSERALVLVYGGKTELLMLIADRIALSVSREGTETPAAMVALAQSIDLATLATLARRIPAPPG